MAGLGLLVLALGILDFRSHDLERAIERRIRLQIRKTLGEEAAKLMERRLKQGMRAKMDAVGLSLPELGSYSVMGGMMGAMLGGAVAVFGNLTAALPVLLLGLGSAGFFLFAPYVITSRYGLWQRQVIQDMPDLILWLDLFLSLGNSVSTALERASRRLIPGRPLAREIERLFRDIAQHSDFTKALSDIELRMGNQDLIQFWEGIRAGWTSAAPTETLRGIASTIDRLEDLAVAQKTSRAGMLMPLLLGGLFMVIVGFVTLPLMQQFMGSGSLLGGL